MVQGNINHDDVDSGYPVKIGGKAETTVPSAVSDGDRVNAWFDEYGRIVVALKDASGNQISLADDAAFTPGISSVLPVGFFADETTPDSVDEGDVGAARMTLSRILWTALRTKTSVSADTELMAGQQAKASSLSVAPATDITDATYIGDIKFGEGLPANSGVDIGDVDVTSLPAGNLGQQASAASLSIVPASDVADATYIGDIKFGESLPAGTAAIGKLAPNSGVDIGDVDVISATFEATDDGAITLGTQKIVPMGALADETTPDSVDEGDVGVPRMTLNRVLRVVPSLHDGTTEGVDSQRNNIFVTALASAVRNSDAYTDLINYNHQGVIIYVNVSAVTGDDTVKLIVEGQDQISGGLYTILSGAELGTTGLRIYEIHPNVGAASGGVTAVANRLIPRHWRVALDYTQVGGVADTITASLGVHYVL